MDQLLNGFRERGGMTAMAESPRLSDGYAAEVFDQRVPN
jgi:hypothetical protein